MSCCNALSIYKSERAPWMRIYDVGAVEACRSRIKSHRGGTALLRRFGALALVAGQATPERKRVNERGKGQARCRRIIRLPGTGLVQSVGRELSTATVSAMGSFKREEHDNHCLGAIKWFGHRIHELLASSVLQLQRSKYASLKHRHKQRRLVKSDTRSTAKRLTPRPSIYEFGFLRHDLDTIALERLSRSHKACEK